MLDNVSGAIAIPKASWGCAPALPNCTQVVFLRQATNIPFTNPRQTTFAVPIPLKGDSNAIF